MENTAAATSDRGESTFWAKDAIAFAACYGVLTIEAPEDTPIFKYRCLAPKR